MKIFKNKSAGSSKRLRLMALLAVLALGAVAAVSAFATSRPARPSINGPHNPSNKTRASFRFHGHGSVRYQCSLDGGKIKPCSSPKTYSKLSPGRHSLRVRARDPHRALPPGRRIDPPPTRRGAFIALNAGTSRAPYCGGPSAG